MYLLEFEMWLLILANSFQIVKGTEIYLFNEFICLKNKIRCLEESEEISFNFIFLEHCKLKETFILSLLNGTFS